MKILQVIHDFLPRHNAGSEICTYYLSRELGRRHEVAVFCTECIPDKAQYTLYERRYEGIPVFEAVHNHAYRTFEQTYLDARMDRLFRGILRRFRPDVVHLQHLQYHSIGYIREAHALGIPVVFTLHEYFLLCPRKGLMLRDDLSLCSGVDVDRCADCLQNDSMMPGIVGETRFRLDEWAKAHVPARLRRMVHKRLVKYGLVSPPAAKPPEPAGRDHREEIRSRRDAVLERCREVDLFLSPSRFLRRKFIEFGIDPERIRFSDNGFVDAGYGAVERTPSDRVRFGFVGTLVAFKGAHLAVEAFHRLPEDANAELRIYGDLETFPPYTETLRARLRDPRCRLMGRFENAKVAEILASLDVLVVPSVWYENSPLTIHEAFLSGVPVIATDLGGMADLVEDGVNGLLFERGNAESLARKMEQLVREPATIRRLADGIGEVKTIEEQAREVEAIYEELIEKRKGGGETSAGPGVAS
jgi:glycosyltransferase involved in cell wall biosynthesis